MTINKIPGVYYTETTSYENIGAGSKIPVFIGKTGNTGSGSYKVDGTVILSFNNYNDAAQPITAGGIGTNPSTNPILAALKDFFAENERKTSGDISVPHVYVIDCGAATSLAVWTTAFATAKKKRDADIEVYIGAENVYQNDDIDITDVLSAASESLRAHATNLMLRCGFYTDSTADTDTKLIALSQDIKLPRIGLIEPTLFGKTIARICCTPFYLEPGFTAYRTVSPGTFKERTPTQELSLQNNAVIFNHDEHTSRVIYPKINLAVMSTFSLTERPADALFHARYNADTLLKEVFDVCYSQVKNNETNTNIAYLQSQVDKVVDTAVNNGYMKAYDGATGTKLFVAESDSDPYDIVVTGTIMPVNATIAINVNTKITGAI